MSRPSSVVAKAAARSRYSIISEVEFSLLRNVFLTQIAAVLVMMSASIVTARAQVPPLNDVATRRPPVAPVAAIGPELTGIWSGTAIHVQRSVEYRVVLEITAGIAQITYPESHCGGKLKRVGVSMEYAFFVEKLVRGPSDGGGRCTDGTVTVARTGENLAWAWFAVEPGAIEAAYGTLTRRAEVGEADAQLITGATGRAPQPRTAPRRYRARPTPLSGN
jgi:hypothetical protein